MTKSGGYDKGFDWEVVTKTVKVWMVFYTHWRALPSHSGQSMEAKGTCFKWRPWTQSRLNFTGNSIVCFIKETVNTMWPSVLCNYRWTSGSVKRGVFPWASCQIRKIAGAHAPGMPGTFSPSPQLNDPDMHHGTCLTHVPWCMPGSLTSGFLCNRRRGKTFPAFPAHAQPAILRIW